MKNVSTIINFFGCKGITSTSTFLISISLFSLHKKSHHNNVFQGSANIIRTPATCDLKTARPCCWIPLVVRPWLCRGMHVRKCLCAHLCHTIFSEQTRRTQALVSMGNNNTHSTHKALRTALQTHFNAQLSLYTGTFCTLNVRSTVCNWGVQYYKRMRMCCSGEKQLLVLGL